MHIYIYIYASPMYRSSYVHVLYTNTVISTPQMENFNNSSQPDTASITGMLAQRLSCGDWHGYPLLAAPVVRELVRAASSSGLDSAVRGQGAEASRDLVRGLEALESLQIEHEARDVRRGHRRPREDIGRGGGSNPGRQDIHTGREDVEDGAVIGERGSGVVGLDGADCDRVGGRGRAVIGSVCLFTSRVSIPVPNSMPGFG